MDQRINEMSALPNKNSIQAWMPNEALHDVTSGILIPWSPDPKNVGHGRLPSKEPQGYNKLVKITNELLELSYKNELPYDLVVLDTLSAMSDHWVALLMYTHRVTFMTERLWGIYLSGMNEYVNGFLRLKCDRIIIAHEKRSIDEGSKVDIIRPNVAGQTGNNLVKNFTEAYYLAGRGNDGKYRMRTVSDYIETSIGPRLTARTSRGLQPEEISGPDIYKRRSA